MRTLKKSLCFVLALVMVLGLCAFGVSADSTTATLSTADVSDGYKEAAKVVAALGIFTGGDGTSWSTQLTRAQAATLLTRLRGIDATTLDYTSNTFVDLDQWQEKYVAYAERNGLIVGVGNGRFDPQGALTGYQWGLMLLRALGYVDSAEGVTSENWQVITARLARQNDLDKGIDDMSKQLTREQAAQMTFNALKADVVKYGTGVTVTTTDGTGIKVTGGRETETTTASWGNAISDKLNNGNRIVQLGEQLYKGDLELTEGYDDFGRPDCDTWTYKGREIVTMQASTDHLVTTFVGKVKYKDIYSALGSAVMNKASSWINFLDDAEGNVFPVYVDGRLVRLDTADFTKSNGDGLEDNDGNGLTGDSVYTELYSEYVSTAIGGYYDITIVVINTYLAEATGGYNSSKNTLGITTDRSVKLTLSTYTLDAEDVTGPLDSFSAKDKLLFTCAYNGDNKYEVKEVFAPTILEGAVVTAYGLTSDNNGDSVTADGTKYGYSKNDSEESSYVSLIKNFETNDNNLYDIYLDAYGNVVYAKGSTAAGRYVYVRDLGQEWNVFDPDGEDGDVKAKITSTDGKNSTVKVDKFYAYIAIDEETGIWDEKQDASKALKAGTLASGEWYKYSINSDGDYVLRQLGVGETQNSSKSYSDVEGLTMSKSIPDLFGDRSAIANGSTVFIVKDTDADTTTVYRGISKLPDITFSDKGSAGAIVNDKGYATYVYVVSGKNGSVTDSTSLNWAFINSAKYTKGYDSVNKVDTYTYEAVVKGEETTITVIDDALQEGVGLYYWYSTKYDYPNDLTKVPTTKTIGKRLDAVGFVGWMDFEDDTLVIHADDNYYKAIASDATVWFVNEKEYWNGGDVHQGSIASVVFNEFVDDGNYSTFEGFVYFVTRSTDDEIISEVYFLGTDTPAE